MDPVRFGRSPADDPGAAVLRAEQGSEPGTVDGKYLDARAGADGLVQVRVTGGDNGSRTYVIPAGTVRAAGPWVLPPPVVRANTTTTVRQDVTLSAATLDLLRRTVAGRTAPVLADTTDSRCTLSRDPLSLPPRGIVTSISAATQDAAGNLFVPIFVTPNRRALFVVTAAGELRRMPIAGDPQTVQGTPDGGLLVLTTVGRGRRVYRFADSAAAARDAQRLPARPDDCVSDNRASAPTATRTVVTGVAVSGVADDTALLGRDGSTLRSATSGIELSAPGRPTRTVDAVGSGRAYGVTADGRGGGWWFRSTGTRPPVLRHVDAAGKVRTLASGLPALTGLAEDANPATEFDAADGSLYWRDATAAVSRWQRTTLAGATVATGFFGDRAWFGGGVAYLQLTSRSEVGRQRGTGAPVPMLATAPNLTSLIASVVRRTGPATVAASGLSADRKGRLLVWQGRWLGRVDGSRITLLAGPSDGLPHVDEARAITVSGDELIFVADGRVKRVSIR